MQHTRASTRTESTGDSGTSTIIDTELSTPGGSASVERSDGVLHLRGSSSPQGRRRVTWTEGVVDNEGMNKKKTKVCCIYHKPREFGESSSDDEDSSTDSENDSDTNGPGGEPSEERGSSHRNSKGCRSHASRRKNAYEKNPVAGKDK